MCQKQFPKSTLGHATFCELDPAVNKYTEMWTNVPTLMSYRPGQKAMKYYILAGNILNHD